MITCSSSPLVPVGSSVLVRATVATAISALFILFPATASFADRPADPSVEVSLIAGGGFGGSVKVSAANEVNLAGAYLDVGAGWAAGVVVGLRPRSDEGGLIVLTYSRQRSQLTLQGLNVAPGNITEVDIGFLQIGGEIDGNVTPHIKPFFGLTIGATHYSPVSSLASTEWFFSAGFYGGLKFPINDHFGFRTQGRMMGTVIGSEKNLWCIGGGCVVSVSDVTGPIQGDLMAGIYVSF